MQKVISIEDARKTKEDHELFEKIQDLIVGKYNDYLLVLSSDGGVSYSHSGKNPEGVELIAKFIQQKELCGVIAVDDFLKKLGAVLKT